MGCTQSKIENEEAVTRCKERKHFMKEAVSARNAFAAAHSAYTMSLKNTGAALSDYAHGEVLNPQSITLNPHHSSPALSLPPSDPPPPLPMDPLVPPPPPPDPFPPIQRAVSMPAINLSDRKEKDSRETNGVAAATIMEEEDEEEGVESSQEKLITRNRSSGRNRSAAAGGDHRSAAVENGRTMQAPQQQDSAWDYFFPPMDNMPGPTLEVKDDKGDVIEHKVHKEMPKRVEEEQQVAAEAEVEPPIMEEEKRNVVEDEVGVAPPPPPESGVGSVGGMSLKKGKASVVAGGTKGAVNLLQVLGQLDDHFLKASESAQEVSKMLEATRLHYHSNFADNRGNSLALLVIKVVS